MSELVLNDGAIVPLHLYVKRSADIEGLLHLGAKILSIYLRVCEGKRVTTQEVERLKAALRKREFSCEMENVEAVHALIRNSFCVRDDKVYWINPINWDASRVTLPLK